MPTTKTYHPAWDDMRRAAYERAGYVCEHCGLPFGEDLLCTSPDGVRRDGKPLVLTVHHLDGDTANNDWTNLLACCQRCHLHVQAVWAPGDVLPRVWDAPPAWLLARELDYDDNPQLSLWAESED